MAEVIVQPIVEGHGEVEAVPVLLRHLWYGLGLGTECALRTLRPIRQPRSSLTIEGRLRTYVEFAARKLTQESKEAHWLLLILLDADEDAPCVLGPRLLAIARAGRSDIDSACVVATREYETWFVASAESLIAAGHIREDARISEAPEAENTGKGWVKRNISKGSYSETADQAKLTAAIDIETARRRSPSFDKLCRELEGVSGRVGP